MATLPTPQPAQSRMSAFLAVHTADPDVLRRGQTLHTWNIITLVGLLASLVFSALRNEPDPVFFAISGVGAALVVLSFLLTRRGLVRPAAVLVLALWVLGVGAVGLQRGPYSPTLLFLIIPMVTAATVLSPASGLWLGLLIAGGYLALLALARTRPDLVGSMSDDLLRSQISTWYPMLMAIVGLVVWLLARSLESAIQQARAYNIELEKGRRELEKRVHERTRELQEANRQLTHYTHQIEASAKVGQATTQLLGLNRLLPYAAELIRSEFGYYQVSVFLLDEDGQWLTIQGSSGAAGPELISQSFKLSMGQTSIIGQAAGRRQAYLVPEVTRDPYYQAHPLLPETRSEIALPLTVGDRLIGVLDIQSNTPNTFDSSSIQPLAVMTNQLAIAIDNARKFLDEAAILEETSTFHRHSREISLATTRPQVGQALMDYTASTPVDASRLLLIENSPAGVPTWIVMQEGWTADNRPSEPLGTRTPLKAYALEPFIARDQIVVVEDIQSDSRANPAAMAAMANAGLRSIAIIPLRSETKWVGAWLIGRNKPSQFEHRLIRSYRSLADQAATALENIALLEETRHRTQRDQMLSAITAELRSQATTDQVLAMAAQQIGQILGASRVGIRLFGQGDAGNGTQS